MLQKRRSGRIAKEIDIILLGTDTTGKVFSEQTKTVVLSRHGAGVLSRYRFAPDEVLTLRMPSSTKEAEVRLIGQIGGEPGRYVYGVAFVDPDPHFWPMEFPFPDSFESASLSIVLECSLCQARQNVEQHEIEEDVYSVNGNILRYCELCGTSTRWKKSDGTASSALSAPPAPSFSDFSETARSEAVPASALARSKQSFESPVQLSAASSTTAYRTTVPVSSQYSPESAAAFSAALPPPHASSPPASALPQSPYSAASTIPEFTSFAEMPASPAVSNAAAVLEAPESATVLRATQLASPATRSEEASDAATKPPRAYEASTEAPRMLDASGRPINRRSYIRIRVNFSACVRHHQHADEVVECENMSKGGVCFHSVQNYALGSRIEIAAPFYPGESALFVPAQIRRVEPLSGGKVFRYGVEYIRSSVPGQS